MFNKALVCSVMICGPLIFIGNSWAGSQRDAVCQGSCGGGCGPCAGNNSAPAGPTQEELKKQSEAKDLQEAADDAEDKGDSAYKKGDFAGAVKYFNESLNYSPDDSNIRNKLSLAQKRLSESEAARQLMTTEHHSTIAAPMSNEPASAEAQRGFDTAGNPAGNLKGSAVYAGAGGGGDPVVPASKRTRLIRELENKRDNARKNIAMLEAEKKMLDPKTDAVKISEIKQKESKAEQTVHYLNFSINADLEKPSPTTKNKPADPKTNQ
jgi:hypothetical protein